MLEVLDEDLVLGVLGEGGKLLDDTELGEDPEKLVHHDGGGEVFEHDEEDACLRGGDLVACLLGGGDLLLVRVDQVEQVVVHLHKLRGVRVNAHDVHRLFHASHLHKTDLPVRQQKTLRALRAAHHAVTLVKEVVALCPLLQVRLRLPVRDTSDHQHWAGGVDARHVARGKRG